MSTEIDAYAGSATHAAVQALSAGSTNVFSTIKGNDPASKLAVFEATTASVPLADNLNKPINLANIVVQVIDINDEEADPQTGEVGVSTVPRTILIDKDGTAYHAISSGIFKSVENLMGILGSDPGAWGVDVVVKAVKGGTGTRQYMTLVPAKSGK